MIKLIFDVFCSLGFVDFPSFYMLNKKKSFLLLTVNIFANK
jgi:hypothetical protein